MCTSVQLHIYIYIYTCVCIGADIIGIYIAIVIGIILGICIGIIGIGINAMGIGSIGTCLSSVSRLCRIGASISWLSPRIRC